MKIKVTIDPNGEVTTEYEGFTGDQCFEIAKALYDVLQRHGVHLGTPLMLRPTTRKAPLQPRIKTPTGV